MKLTIAVCLAFAIINVCTAENAAGPAGIYEVAERVAIQIDANAPRVAVSPELYGFFFEEISHAGDGGLYAELVENRDFEANTLPEGWRVDANNVFTPLGWRTRLWFDSNLPSWSLVASDDAEGRIQQDSALPLNDRNPHSLRLTVKRAGKRCGISNDGYWGMNFQAGELYDLTFYTRTEGDAKCDVTVSLESQSGDKVYAKATIAGVGGAWKKYSQSLKADASDPKGRLVLSLSQPGTVWFDVVSLFPRKTFKNRPNGMRPDLAQLLADIKPGFLRFPGGCVVEGASLYNRIRWKDSIGDIAQRRGDFDLWGYYNTYGLGFHEYLQLAEDIGAAAMYVCNAGMSCQGRRPEICSEQDLQNYVQEALDAIEYAIGPVTSKWGAQRAANGHPEPFNLKYVEIGNENRGPDYQLRYKVFYEAIKARYPKIITIADTRFESLPVEIADDHFYVNPGRFFGMAKHYDNSDRKGPKIYVGEYAVNRGVGQGNLLGALSEAVFMLNMESNSDIVVMCSYAPLFENVNKRDWPVNLILLDSSRSVGRSSYQVQKLFALNRPDVAFKTRVLSPQVELAGVPATMPRRGRDESAQPQSTQPVKVQQLYALAGLDKKNGEVVIKAVNPTPSSVTATVTIKGLANIGGKAKIITLSNDATAENTLDNSNVVVPVESGLSVAGAEFSCEFKPNSLTILRLPASDK
jgi:alpha-L-arabinofuranosidase